MNVGPSSSSLLYSIVGRSCDILDFSYDQLVTFYMVNFRLLYGQFSSFYMVNFRFFIWQTFAFLFGQLDCFMFNVKLKNQSRLHCARPKQSSPSSNPTRMGPSQQSDHLVQNCQTGEQMTHWDMLNKATKFEFFSVPLRLQFSDLYHVIVQGPVSRKSRNFSGVNRVT